MLIGHIFSKGADDDDDGPGNKTTITGLEKQDHII